MPETIEIRQPDNFHVHLRAPRLWPGAAPYDRLLEWAAPLTAANFRRALVMPNVPAITDHFDLDRYRVAILRATEGLDFMPIMSAMLTPESDPEWAARMKDHGAVACKLYPKGVTTGSDHGIDDPYSLRKTYGAMSDLGLVLCIHAEQPGAFVLDREAEYLAYVRMIVREFPALRVVVEHISTAAAVACVFEGPGNLAATITPMHLWGTLDMTIGDGIRPGSFFYPVPKTPRDREFLLLAAGSGNEKFFAGTDSAPHVRSRKESSCGCAGAFSETVALACYAATFEKIDRVIRTGRTWVERLDAFLSTNGADFYGLPRNPGTIRLVRDPWKVPAMYRPHGALDEANAVEPFLAGETLDWRLDP